MPNWNTIRAVYRGSTPVDKVYVGEDWKWPPHDFLTFSSPNSFDISVNNSTKNWNGTLEYSTDKYTWTTWDGSQSISAVADNGTYYLYLRGLNNTKITGAYDSTTWPYSWYVSGTNVSINGDIRYLLDYQNPENSKMSTACFAALFYNCSSIISSPELSITSLTSHCYRYMFYGCTSLVNAPELPATTLANSCYYSMFYGCTSLVNAPELPATTLANNCYYYMFRGCGSLLVAPELPATNLATQCYYGMFYACTSLVNAPELPATTLVTSCYNRMFYQCSSLVSCMELSATVLAESCYNRMFFDCDSLESIPNLPALDIPTNAYIGMFQNCLKIKMSVTQTGDYQTSWRFPTTGTGTLTADAANSMFSGTSGTFVGAPSVNTTYYTSNTVI